MSSSISSECSGETAPSVLVNDLMCWLIRVQKPYHSRLFEARADPESGAEGGGGGQGGVCQTYIYFKQAIFLNMLWVPPRIQKGGDERGSNSGNFLVAHKYHSIGPSSARQ